MAKLTKAQRKAHAETEAILTKERLTEDEREFVFRNWHEGAEFINGSRCILHPLRSGRRLRP